MNSKERWLVCTDRSQHSYEVINWVATHQLPNTQVILLNVVDKAEYYLHSEPEWVHRLQEELIEESKKWVRTLEDHCSSKGITITASKQVVGDAREEITRAVVTEQADLLVLGHRTDRERADSGTPFAGSVSEYCVGHSKCTVVVVK